MQKLLQILTIFLPTQTVYAHCDVPCGIYDPKTAQTAAATILKMVQKIKELEYPKDPQSPEALHYGNSLVRMIWTKEEHARRCKEELLILWTDYFKPEHLKKFPNLHDTFWKAAKLCSKNKQTIDIDLANELVTAVDEIANIFQQSKSS